MNELLSDRTALVTGASRGIGRAIAVELAEHGAFVGINYVKSKDKARDVLEEIQKRGGNGLLLQANVSQEIQVRKMIDALVKEREGIDIIVNNAGIYYRSAFGDITSERWNEVINVNLKGCYAVCKYAIPYLKEEGKIVFISSQLAFKGSSHGVDYATSKAGMLGLMKSLALELTPQKINVNAIAPGTIDTDIIAHYTKKQREKRIDAIPLKRLGKPEDVAHVCLFLVSPLSDYITGETIHVNGGLYLH